MVEKSKPLPFPIIRFDGVPSDGDVFYRYEDYLEATATYDGCGGDTYYHSVCRVRLLTFPVLRRTRCGVWIENGDLERFVLNTSRKRFAVQSEELARESFIERKKAQIRRLNNQLAIAHTALSYFAPPAQSVELGDVFE